MLPFGGRDHAIRSRRLAVRVRRRGFFLCPEVRVRKRQSQVVGAVAPGAPSGEGCTAGRLLASSVTGTTGSASGWSRCTVRKLGHPRLGLAEVAAAD